MQQCPIVGKPKPQSISANQAISAFIRYGGRSIYDLQYLSMPYAFHGREHVDVHTRDSSQYQTRCDVTRDAGSSSQTELLVLVLSVILTSHSRTSRHGSYAPQGQAKHETWPHRYGTQALDVFSTLKVLPIVAGPKVGRDGWRQPIGGHRRCLCALDGRRSRAGYSHRRLC
jgi:hypothetical protein